MKRFLIFTMFSLTVFIYFAYNSFSYSKTMQAGLAEDIIRLHIVANSNEEVDQELKYKIRDKVLTYIKKQMNDVKSKKACEEIIIEKINEIKELVEKEVKKEGKYQDVEVGYGEFDFPTKQYGDVILPAGKYTGLKINLGEAKGQNWWCVMFPPLCFVDVNTGVVPEDSKNQLKNNLTEEEYLLITSQNNPPIKVKFKILEMVQQTKLKFAQKEKV